MSRLGSLFRSLFLNAQRLFHLLVALAFMVLTVMGASLTWSEWEGHQKTPGQEMIHFWMFGGFTIFLAILCLYSFAKARSVR